jgi:hypothetical protein
LSILSSLGANSYLYLSCCVVLVDSEEEALWYEEVFKALEQDKPVSLPALARLLMKIEQHLQRGGAVTESPPAKRTRAKSGPKTSKAAEIPVKEDEEAKASKRGKKVAAGKKGETEPFEVEMKASGGEQEVAAARGRKADKLGMISALKSLSEEANKLAAQVCEGKSAERSEIDKDLHKKFLTYLRRDKNIPALEAALLLQALFSTINWCELDKAVDQVARQKQPRGLRGTLVHTLNEAKEFLRGYALWGKSPVRI